MKKLIVAEKPSVARDIARVLGAKNRGEGYLYGEEYVITWALGHLVSLCEPGEVDERWQKWNMNDLPMLPRDIPLKVLPATAGQFKCVSALMNSDRIDSLICATDSAREGELIFRYIYQKAGCKKPVKRLWISSMTDAAIRKGFSELKSDACYDALYESARCRSVADWLVGMNASRAFSLRYNAHLSIGRVQTPTLNLIVRRDLEIENFVPCDYWEVRANFGDYEGLWINPELQDDGKGAQCRAMSKEQAEQVKAQVVKKRAVVAESSAEVKRIPPPQLFDLTTLQREANRKFSYSADKTLKLAQALYERHKLLTYPRTDSRYLSDDMLPKVKSTLSRLPEPYAALVRAEARDVVNGAAADGDNYFHIALKLREHLRRGYLIRVQPSRVKHDLLLGARMPVRRGGIGVFTVERAALTRDTELRHVLLKLKKAARLYHRGAGLHGMHAPAGAFSGVLAAIYKHLSTLLFTETLSYSHQSGCNHPRG